MIRRAIFLSVVLSIFLAGSAQAGFTSGGWGYTLGFSVDARFELRGAGNVEDGDRVRVEIKTISFEYACGNPGANTFSVTGTPGEFNLNQEEDVFNGFFVTKGGKVTVAVRIETKTIEDGLEGVCVNDNWDVVVESLALTAFEATAIWFDIKNGEVREIDTIIAMCTLDPIDRDPDTKLPIVPQTYNCVDITDL